MKRRNYNYYLLQHNPKNSKSGQYIIGVTKVGVYYDLFFREKHQDKWEAWPEPLLLNRKELTVDEKEGYVIKVISKDDVFVIVL